MSTLKTRQTQFPKNLRTWVAERAAEGDARAAAQLRGWRYADQRNQRRLDTNLESNALHIGPPPEDDQKSDWADFIQQRLLAQQKQQALANQIAAARIWTINRKTGDVSYMLNGRVSVIGRGGKCLRVGDGRPDIRIADRMHWKRKVEADGYLVRNQARHLRPIHGPGDARRLLPGTTPRESSPTPSCATAFHRNQTQN
jgi:hypothetical protein